MYQNAMQTKSDFPSIMTRGKVLENRLDLELESRGTIFQGRDEKAILIKKKQDEQNAIKEALQKQIEEKNRKKEFEKAKEKEFQAKEEERIKNEVPYEPTYFKRKTQYNNHNQISIVGSGGPNGSFPPQEGAGMIPMSPGTDLIKNGAGREQ